MELVKERLENRAESTGDEGFYQIFEEVNQNEKLYLRELEEATLKHGTDTANFENIAVQGLVPGSENEAETGESSEHPYTCFSTSYPVALRYAEITEANRFLRDSEKGISSIGNVDSPMIIEIPVQNFESLKVDTRNEKAVKRILGADLDQLEHNQASRVSEICKSDCESQYSINEFIEYDEDSLLSDINEGDQEALRITYSILHGEEVKPEDLNRYGFFDELDHNELNASFLNEICSSHGPTEGMVLYVPHQELEQYRQRVDEHDMDIEVGSLEGRALIHEARLKEDYERKGCIDYTKPGESNYRINVIDQKEENAAHNSSPSVVHISRFDGEPVYR